MPRQRGLALDTGHVQFSSRDPGNQRVARREVDIVNEPADNQPDTANVLFSAAWLCQDRKPLLVVATGICGEMAVQVELEFFPWLSEGLGGKDYRSRHLKWQVDVSPSELVGELFARLAAQNESFARLVFDPQRGYLHEVIAVVLNDRLLDLTGGLKTPLTDGDRLVVVPALAGGCFD